MQAQTIKYKEIFYLFLLIGGRYKMGKNKGDGNR